MERKKTWGLPPRASTSASHTTDSTVRACAAYALRKNRQRNGAGNARRSEQRDGAGNATGQATRRSGQGVVRTVVANGGRHLPCADVRQVAAEDAEVKPVVQREEAQGHERLVGRLREVRPDQKVGEGDEVSLRPRRAMYNR